MIPIFGYMLSLKAKTTAKHKIANQLVRAENIFVLKASELRSKYQFSFWDSLIVSTALYAQTTFLISEDMQHGLIVEQSLEIINPFQ